MSTIDFLKLRSELASTATFWFNIITDLPQGVREDKIRTGVQVVIGDMESRNFVDFPIYKPSDQGVHFVSEKITRMNVVGHFSSGNSADEAKMRFPGAIAIIVNGIKYSAGASGLKSEEDVFLAIMMLSQALEMSPREICSNIREHGGKLPECFSDEKHYLYAFVHSAKPIKFSQK